MMTRTLALGLTLVLAAACAEDKGGAKGGVDKKTAAAIDAAVAKGVAWLKPAVASELSTSDTVAAYQHNGPSGMLSFSLHQGRLALMGLALLEGGLPPSDTTLKRVWAALRAKPAATTYDAGVSLLFAEAYLRAEGGGKKIGTIDPAVKAWIQRTADYLASGCFGGVWTYACPGGGYPIGEDPKKAYVIGAAGDAGGSGDEDLVKEVQAGRARNPYKGDFDHSNSQYAILGLKAAALCGIQVKNARLMWRTVIYHFIHAQESDGPGVNLQLTREESKFKVVDYMQESSQPRARGWSYGQGQTAYGTMTAAGMTALLVAQSLVPDLSSYEHTQVRVSARDALAWFQQNWSVDKNPLGDKGMVYSVASRYYHLYGLERVGMLTAVRALAGHSWYKEGAEVLLKEQQRDGSWSPDVAPEDTRLKTAFAILFLARSTRAEYAVGGAQK